METKSRLLAYAVIILLAGYFYSDYAKAEQTAHYCGSKFTEVEIDEQCEKGDVIVVDHFDTVRKACDFSYQIFEFGKDKTFWMCVYQGSLRTPRKWNPYPEIIKKNPDLFR